LKKIKISIVNYTNTLPFKWALKRNPLREKIDLQEDIPSICGQKLKFNQVDLALIPVAVLAELDDYFIETNFCIAAVGKVDSVKLYSHVPLHDITHVTLDYQSKSSIALAQILFKFFWKLNVVYVDAKPGFENEIKASHAAVVIGDRTFGMNGNFAYEYDLAEEWQAFTSLPFVFAVWVSTKKLPEDFIAEFNSVLAFGVSHITEAIDEDYEVSNFSKNQTLHYLTKRIDYRLNEEKQKAIDLFLSYLKR
jgi:chorismate dehydratase